MQPRNTLILGVAITCLIGVAILVAIHPGSTPDRWPRNPAEGPAATGVSPSTSASDSGPAAAPVRIQVTSPEVQEGRANYDFITTLECPEDRGSGRFAIDAGFQDMFGCEAKDQCSVSPWGALRRSFERRRFHAGEERGDSCAKPPISDADCVDHVCVVPSDRSCSPGLFADAGWDDPRDLDTVLGIPGTERPTKERLFVIAESHAREGAGAPRAEAYWTPSFEEVLEVESRLRDALAVFSCDSRAAAIASRLAAYRAQFIGVVERGKRRILGNYVCTRWLDALEAQHPGLRFQFDARWLSDVQDGGECFLHFWYDPGDKSVHGLSINGDG